MKLKNKLKEYNDLITIIYNNISNYNDQELSDKLKIAYSKIPYNMEINCVKINKILKKRVENYCEYNNIDISEYDECLPYRVFKIPVDGLLRQQDEQQNYQLMSKYHEKIQWDDNLGVIDFNNISQNIEKEYWYPIKK